MVITYSGKSAIGAQSIADCSDDIFTNRGSRGDINWGREYARTELNPDISNSTNKRVMRELFRENDVPMPRLVKTDGYEGQILTLGAIRDCGAIVGRSDQHTKGRGFWLCRSWSDVQRALRGTRKKKPATHFMEYIEAPREYRVHIFLGNSIRISEKQFDGSSKHKYVTIKPQHRVKHVRKAAKKAVEAVGLDFGAVDILADDDNCWVLEVNAAPGLGGSMPRLYADVFTKYMEGDW